MRLLLGNSNQEYAEWLANLSYDTRMHGTIPLPLQTRQRFYQTEDFYNHIFPNPEMQFPLTDFFTHRAILTTRNDTASIINNIIFQTFQYEEPAQSFELS